MESVSVEDHYNTMLKHAAYAGLDPDILHSLLTKIAKDNIKYAADTQISRGILQDLRAKQMISDTEQKDILDYLSSSSETTVETIERATEYVANKEAVRLALSVLVTQPAAQRAEPIESMQPVYKNTLSSALVQESEPIAASDIEDSKITSAADKKLERAILAYAIKELAGSEV